MCTNIKKWKNINQRDKLKSAISINVLSWVTIIIILFFEISFNNLEILPTLLMSNPVEGSSKIRFDQCF